MGMDDPIYSASEQEVPSVKLGIFFNELVDKLKVHEEGRGKHFEVSLGGLLTRPSSWS